MSPTVPFSSRWSRQSPEARLSNPSMMEEPPMNQAYNPGTVAPPSGYSHAVEIGPNSRVLYLAGQLGIAPDGTLAKDIHGQTELVWTNIRNVLAAAGMELTDIVKMNHY